MADSKSEAGNVQDESETSCHTRKQGSYERWRESHQKDLGDSLKWLPMAEDGIIWASIITAVNFSIKYVKYLFVIILEKKKKKERNLTSYLFRMPGNQHIILKKCKWWGKNNQAFNIPSCQNIPLYTTTLKEQIKGTYLISF